MNAEQLRIEELKSKLALSQDDLSIRTDELERVESERDALQARVKRLEDELNDNGLVLQKLQDERDKAISMVDRLEKALGLVLKMRNDWLEIQDQGYAGAYYAFVKGNDDEWDVITKAKESKL